MGKLIGKLRDRLTEWRGDPWLACSALFVLSTGRTGTDSLARSLSLFPGVRVHHEPCPQLKRERQQAFWDVHDRPADYARVFRDGRRRLVGEAHRRGLIYAETSARLTFFAPVIVDLMPNSKFLYIHRHAADVIRSGMRRGWYDHHPDDPFRILPPPGSDAANQWDGWTRFQKICWYWDAYNRFALDFTSLVDKNHLLVLAAERFFGSPMMVLHEMASLMGVSSLPEDRLREVAAKPHNVQANCEFPALHEWTPEMKHQCEAIAGETMARLGYNLDAV